MENKDQLLELLGPIVVALKTLDPKAATAAATLFERFPLDGASMRQVRALVREGVEARWLAEKESSGVRFGRVTKDLRGYSVDVVHLASAGAAHTHPQGEFDLCFAVSGAPRFDGRSEGWTVYGPGTWHVPTVQGGAMDILYFLPGAAIRFEDQPADAAAVGLQAK